MTEPKGGIPRVAGTFASTVRTASGERMPTYDEILRGIAAFAEAFPPPLVFFYGVVDSASPSGKSLCITSRDPARITEHYPLLDPAWRAAIAKLMAENPRWDGREREKWERSAPAGTMTWPTVLAMLTRVARDVYPGIAIEWVRAGGG